MAGASAKTAFVYFSATGTTERMAKNAAHAMGADIFEIEPVHKYTDADLNWHDKKSLSSIECNDPKSRPAIKNKIDISQATTPWFCAIQSGGHTRRKSCTHSSRARIGQAKKSWHSAQAEEAVWVAAERILQNMQRGRPTRAEKILPEAQKLT